MRYLAATLPGFSRSIGLTSRTGRCAFAALVGWVMALRGATAQAQSCTENGLSTCVDANPLWLPAGPSRFVSVDSESAMHPNALALAAGFQFISHPIIIRAPGPDPYGTEVAAVKRALQMDLLGAFGILPRLELTLALPVVISQNGSGVSSATSVAPTPIASTALKDPRIGLGFDLFNEQGDVTLTGKLKYEVSLPLGNDHAFAGERAVVHAPAVAIAARWQEFTFATELGFRLRPQVVLGDTRYGSQLTAAVGLGFSAIDQSRLDLSLEAWAYPSLISQLQTQPSGTVTDASFAPSEWQLAVRTSPYPNLLLQLGMGTAIALSSRTRSTPTGEESREVFSPITAASFRAVLVARYLLR
ncbi:MAG TPA: hypothetical protein VL137_10755 [Polyangiaceae bacterium]|nr:hypothetical protein [Polyangiaceae bacterium]